MTVRIILHITLTDPEGGSVSITVLSSGEIRVHQLPGTNPNSELMRQVLAELQPTITRIMFPHERP